MLGGKRPRRVLDRLLLREIGVDIGKMRTDKSAGDGHFEALVAAETLRDEVAVSPVVSQWRI